MTDQRFRLFTRIVNGLCTSMSLYIVLRWNSDSSWALPIVIVVFGVGVAIQVAVGKRRPGHEHDNFRDALR